MTVGYYAVPEQPPAARVPKTEPWPHCRECVRQAKLEPLAAIDENASPSLKCRRCRARLRQWR
jgi:hypothetical protein